MLCYISYLSVGRKSLLLEVELDPKEDGQAYLNEVCRKLGIVEVDYFGLKFRGNKRETLWLNLRNHVEDQVPGSPPYQLQLRVKFFVQPHYILTDVTRKLFYLQVLEELHHGRLELGEWPQAAHFVALVAQAEHGDHTRHSRGRLPMEAVYRELVEGVLPSPSRSLLASVEEEHRGLAGMLAASARYAMLQDVASHPHFGMEYHEAKLMTPAHLSSFDHVKVAVGPSGVVILQPNGHTTVEKIEYMQIHVATHIERTVILEMMIDPIDPTPKETYSFKLISKRAAIALYRAVTEMHSFFRCDTVCKDICTQFQRDLFGTFASIFNENTSLGKQYIFDIRRTWREAYDHARRQLFMAEQRGVALEAMETDEEEEEERGSRNLNAICNSRCHQRLEQELEALREAFLCCVCMDSQVSTALRPCGHVICCQSCADRLNTCPVCRSNIGEVQPVFLPHLQTNQNQHGHRDNCHSSTLTPLPSSNLNEGTMEASGHTDDAFGMAAEGLFMPSLTEAALSPQVRSLYAGLVEHTV